MTLPVIATTAAAATISAITAATATAAATFTAAAAATIAATATAAATFTAAAAATIATATATATATTSTVATTTTAAAAATAALFGLVDAQGTTAAFGAVQRLHGGLTGFPVGQGHKSEATLTAGVPINGIKEVCQGLPGSEHAPKLGFGGFVRNIAYVEFHGLLRLLVVGLLD